jgi:hypothetical protein
MRMRWLAALPSTAAAIALGCATEQRSVVPDAVPLEVATAEFPEPFTGPIRMAELRDGRVLLMDTRERRLLRIDFGSGQVDTISRQGDGPLEYRSMFVLAQAPGDSVWGFDLVRRRMIVFRPDGEPARSFDLMDGVDATSRLSGAWLRSVNAGGSWLGRAQRFNRQPPRISDTLLVLRTAANGASSDTIARLAGVAPRQNADRSSVITNFSDVDAWAAFSDGTVLVVRGAEYRVQIHHPDGRVVDAGVIPHQRVPLTLQDAETVRDSTAKQLGALVAATLANIPELRNRPLPPTHVLPDPMPTQWPLLVDDDAIAVDRADRAWVRVRTAAFDTGATRFDILSGEGKFIKAVSIPAGEHLVGFGPNAVYVARRDEDELLHLKRYPLP